MTSSDITSNTEVITFAGSPITAGQIDAAELSRVNDLIKQNIYYGNSMQERLIADNAFYTLFDKIEMKKQLALRNLRSIDDLIQQVAPMQPVDVNVALRFYKTHPSLFARSAPRIHVREIVVKDENLASHLVNQLRSGASFVQLAQQYSVDPEQYRDQGGDIGWVIQGQMPPEWDAVAFSLAPSHISNIFQYGKLYYILQVIDGPQYEVIPIDKLSPPLTTIVSRYFQQDLFFDWLSTQIFRETIVVLKPSYLQPLHDALSDLHAHPDQRLSYII